MRPSPRRLTLTAGALLGLTGLVLRFLSTGPLWLDEALSVEIARSPDLVNALRHDGAPPLYYLLLRGWTSIFGTSAFAARSMSAVLGVLSVPAVWAFARTVSTRRVAWVAALLAATSPFAIRYGSEARMYTLVQLLVALGGWALARHLARPTPWNAAALPICSGLLLLTHYWSFYLLAIVGAGLLLRRRWRTATGVSLGVAVFLPWLRSFAYQVGHTGTPWAKHPSPGTVVDAVIEWAGTGPVARLLFVLLLLLAVLGLAGRAVDGRRVELDLRGHPLGRRLAAVTFGTLLLGVLAGLLIGSGYAPRYSAVALVPFLVLVALGTEALSDERVRLLVVGTAAALGLVAAIPGVITPRTQAGVVAAALREGVVPGDLVVYCPDQLGPAVSRLLPRTVSQRVYPTGLKPYVVDWAGYAARNEAADPAAFAADLLRTNGAIWLVVAGGYRTFGNDCDVLAERLRAVRREEPVVRSSRRYGEASALVRFAG